MSSMTWTDRAECLTEDPELFFLIGTEDHNGKQIAEAKEVCARCPVQRECLEDALGRRDRWAIAGGTTPEERRRLERRRARVAAKSQQAA